MPKEFVAALDHLFIANRNPVAAIAMSKYMKNNFQFYGIKKPRRVELTKPLFNAVKKHVTEKWLLETVEICWNKKQREFHYTAMELIKAHKNLLSLDSFYFIEKLILRNSWWDTVDTLTTSAISYLVERYPGLQKEMERYSKHENMWLKRVSIIYQLPYQLKTNEAFLFKVCTAHMHDKEFFIRKAIGWALRQYAKCSPEKVYVFVHENQSMLSPLSIREALKHK